MIRPLSCSFKNLQESRSPFLRIRNLAVLVEVSFNLMYCWGGKFGI